MSEEQQKNETQGAPVSRGTERGAAPDVSRETQEIEKATAPKNKRSSVYIYLVVLFGAAFLMLLLAYFVQQRNNASTISGLQDSWNLSREELLEENRRLTEKNEELEVRVAVLEDQRDRANRQIDELDAQLYAARNDPAIAEQENRVNVLTAMSVMEQALREKNYEAAAKQVRALCTGDWELDLGIMNLDGSEHFDPRGRLTEIIPVLERQGALAQGEIELP